MCIFAVIFIKDESKTTCADSDTESSEISPQVRFLVNINLITKHLSFCSVNTKKNASSKPQDGKKEETINFNDWKFSI